LKIIHILPEVRTSGGITLLQNNLINLTSGISHLIWASKIKEKINFYNTDTILTNHSNIRYFIQIIKRLKTEDNDNTLIHIHGRNGFFVFLAAKIIKIKVIYQAHGYYYKFEKRKLFFLFQNLLDNCLLQFSDFILFTSDGEKKFALKNYNVNIKYKVIYNRSNFVKKKKHIPTTSKKKLIIYCLATSNIYQKGLDNQLLLIKKLKDLNSNFKLIHYFNFQNQYELKILNNQIKSLNLSSHYFLKKATKYVWDEITASGGIVISTSRYEGRNLVIQEAFHNMIPVVATNCIGQNELLEENRGFILKENKFDEWPNILLEALSNEELRKLKAIRANNWIKKFGDMKQYSKELFECYKYVMDL